MRIAIDTGGSLPTASTSKTAGFRFLKSFPHLPIPARRCWRHCDAPEPKAKCWFATGLQSGTNAMIERKGARVAFVTTAGFEDTIAIGRQARARLYDWFQPAPECLAPRICD